MPKVLVVFPVSEVGGGENVMLNLIRFRERRDLDYAALIVSDTDGPLNERLTALGVPQARVARGRMRQPMSLLRSIGAVRREIARVRPDVLLANSSQGFLYASWAAGRRVPAALYFMSVPTPRSWAPLDALVRRTPPNKIFAASNLIRSALEQQGMRHVLTVYHGAPEPLATTDDRAAMAERLRELRIPEDSRIVLLPGRLQRWKGQLAFVRAFAAVAEAIPAAHGVILGTALFGREQDFKEELEGEIRRLHLQSRVHLAGHHTIAPWLEQASCVVHASLMPDAFPNVCIEALAARRPLITNSECGISEILTTGKHAWVIPPRHVDMLSAAIRDVLSDRPRAGQIAESGYRQYLAHCTPSHMVRPIERELCALS